MASLILTPSYVSLPLIRICSNLAKLFRRGQKGGRYILLNVSKSKENPEQGYVKGNSEARKQLHII